MARYKSGKYLSSLPANTVKAKRMRHADIPLVRAKIAKKQKHRCPICNRDMRKLIMTLDHDHVTGYIRGVLCNHCNGNLGKIEGAINRMDVLGIGASIMLERIALWHLSSNLKKKLVHPSAETMVERKDRIKKRASMLKAKSLKLKR